MSKFAQHRARMRGAIRDHLWSERDIEVAGSPAALRCRIETADQYYSRSNRQRHKYQPGLIMTWYASDLSAPLPDVVVLHENARYVVQLMGQDGGKCTAQLVRESEQSARGSQSSKFL